MLRKVTYTLIIIGLLLFLFLDLINLRTYGSLNLFFQLFLIGIAIFMAVVFIIEGVYLITKKSSAKPFNTILVLICTLVVVAVLLFRPVNPHPGVTYTEVWAWEGAHQTGSIFNASGKLKLSNNGRFVLKWRSLFNSWNYYGDWKYKGDTLYLRYEGRPNKRVGTELLPLSKDTIYAYNERYDFAPQVILHRIVE